MLLLAADDFQYLEAQSLTSARIKIGGGAATQGKKQHLPQRPTAAEPQPKEKKLAAKNPTQQSRNQKKKDSPRRSRRARSSEFL